MTDNFLPDTYDKNESLNETGNKYMKFVKGENKFRILEKAIVGWEWWEETPDGKKTPIRVGIDEKIDVSTVNDPNTIRRFWAMPVWNYQLEKIQILEINQKRIQNVLRGLAQSKDWGSPLGYDITVVRTGEGKENTQYEVIPSPPKELSPSIKEEFAKTKIRMEALYEGADPFSTEAPITDADLDAVAKYEGPKEEKDETIPF